MAQPAPQKPKVTETEARLQKARQLLAAGKHREAARITYAVLAKDDANADAQALLRETAEEMGREVTFSGATIEEAWHRLAVGDVLGHNELLAEGIRVRQGQEGEIGCVVLAQLSMTVFLLSHPDPVAEFGVPVFTSGQCGYERVYDLLTST